MTDRPLQILQAGFGAFGLVHAKAWQRVPNVIISICDPNPETATRVREAGLSVSRTGASIDDMLHDCDAVSIVSPVSTHLSLAQKALEHGKHVLIEKPAVSDVGEAERLAALLKLAREMNDSLQAQVGMVLRAHPHVQTAKAMLDRGAIGQLVAMEGDFSGWKRMRSDSGILENDGVHFLDLMRYFAGAAALEVHADGRSHLSPDITDQMRVDLSYPDNVSGHLRLGILAAGESADAFVPGAVTRKSLRLIGMKGNLDIDFNLNRLRHQKVAYTRKGMVWDVQADEDFSVDTADVSPVDLLSASFTRFCTAVRGHGSVLCDVETGALELSRLLHAIQTDLLIRRPAGTKVGVSSDV